MSCQSEEFTFGWFEILMALAMGFLLGAMIMAWLLGEDKDVTVNDILVDGDACTIKGISSSGNEYSWNIDCGIVPDDVRKGSECTLYANQFGSGYGAMSCEYHARSYFEAEPESKSWFNNTVN